MATLIGAFSLHLTYIKFTVQYKENFTSCVVGYGQNIRSVIDLSSEPPVVRLYNNNINSTRDQRGTVRKNTWQQNNHKMLEICRWHSKTQQ